MTSMANQWAFLRKAATSSLPVQAKYRHDLAQGPGEVALQYWPRRDGSTSAPSQLTVFILGNPGLLDYYIPFLNHLSARLPPTHAILSTSHVGHTPELAAPAVPLELAAQLDAKLDMVKDLRAFLNTWSSEAQGSKPELCLMGHSVGSWFMCEIMKRHPADIHAGYLLFPTVGWIADSWNGWKLWVSPGKSIASKNRVDPSRSSSGLSSRFCPCCRRC